MDRLSTSSHVAIGCRLEILLSDREHPLSHTVGGPCVARTMCCVPVSRTIRFDIMLPASCDWRVSGAPGLALLAAWE
jgi:hypothetical protein